MSSSESFNIAAPPNTDIWRKPPSKDIFNAPTAVPPSLPASAISAPLPRFRSARVSFSLPYTAQYDQAGLLLTFSSPSSPKSKPRWIKAGIEFYNSSPRLSVVACDAWADWSVAPLNEPSSEFTSLSIEKEGDENGVSLWVYQILGSGEKFPLREICWVYGDEPEKWELKVEAMAARPAKEEGLGELVASFKGFEVVWV